MKKATTNLFFLLMAGTLSFGQPGQPSQQVQAPPPPADSKPATTNIVGAEYPRIDAQRDGQGCGADGLVFGFLKEDGSLDQARCKEMLALCGGKPAVFHRAIDVVPDWKRTLGDLIDLGFTRVLTSGQAPNVLYGIDTLRAMMDFAGGAIEILPGGGVNQWTLKRLLAETGATQVHFGHTVNRYDHSTEHNPSINFGSSLSPEENRYSVTDAAYIQQMRNI